MFLLLLKLLYLHLTNLLNRCKLAVQIIKFLLKNFHLLAICKLLSSEDFHLNQKSVINWCWGTFLHFFPYLDFCFFQFCCLMIKISHSRLNTWNLPCKIEYGWLTRHYLHLKILQQNRILLQFSQSPLNLIVQLRLLFGESTGILLLKSENLVLELLYSILGTKLQ